MVGQLSQLIIKDWIYIRKEISEMSHLFKLIMLEVRFSFYGNHGIVTVTAVSVA